MYFDEAGNLIDPATGMAVAYDTNGQPVVSQEGQAAAPDGTIDGTEPAAAPEEDVPELVTTPWLAPPPSGPPPGYANWAPPSTVYIPETGHSVDGVFLDSWRAWGGASSWGFPLTAELQENGHIVQYYDYGRFEYHPEDPNGVVVQFGDLGRQLQPFVLRRASGSGSAAVNEAALAARAWAPLEAAARADSETWRFVPETSHAVAGEFKAFWEATGESGYLGNPVSEPYKVDGVTYQVFERGTLEQRSGEPPAMVPIGKMMVERLRLDTTPERAGRSAGLQRRSLHPAGDDRQRRAGRSQRREMGADQHHAAVPVGVSGRSGALAGVRQHGEGEVRDARPAATMYFPSCRHRRWRASLAASTTTCRTCRT